MEGSTLALDGPVDRSSQVGFDLVDGGLLLVLVGSLTYSLFGYNERMVTGEEVREALKVVDDPEIGINIVDLGLIYEVQVNEEGEAVITYTLTSMGCPVGPMLDQEIKETAAALDGIASVSTSLVMQPPWSPDRMSDFAKSALGFF